MLAGGAGVGASPGRVFLGALLGVGAGVWGQPGSPAAAAGSYGAMLSSCSLPA